MRITYIRHSAFLAEWEDIVCLFDYAEGELPEIDRDKRLCVFASHHHSDHFNPEIFTRFADHPHLQPRTGFRGLRPPPAVQRRPL